MVAVQYQESRPEVENRETDYARYGMTTLIDKGTPFRHCRLFFEIPSSRKFPVAAIADKNN